MKNTKILLSTVLALSMLSASAQTKIGNNSTTIDASSILELESSNKALYLNRVSLSSTTDMSTVAAPKAGMTVYNTNVSITGTGANPALTGGIGLYCFDGTRWVGAGFGSNVVADNGLTLGYNSAGNIGLGGTLAKTTDVALGGFNLTFSGLGNVGIGTTTPTADLTVNGNAEFYTGTSRTGNFYSGTSSLPGVQNFSSATDAYIAVQRPTIQGGHAIHITRSGSYVAGIGLMGFFSNGSALGSITSPTNSSVAYNTTSDIRLKENIRTSSYGLKDLMKITVRDYNYKSDAAKTTQNGFIAQQLYSVYPIAVAKGGDDAKTQPWQVDYGKLTPLLVQSVQELNAKLENIVAENVALKAQLAEVAALKTAIADLRAQLIKVAVKK